MLQKYKSHKIVHAGKIQGIRTEERTARPVITALIVGGTEYSVPENFNARGNPEIGDYLVRYEDGYMSWSPASAFEDGYALVEDATGGVYQNPYERQSDTISPAANTSPNIDTDDDVQTDGSVDPVEVGGKE